MKKACVALLVGLFALAVTASAAPDGNERGIAGYGPMLGVSLARIHEKDFDNSLKLGIGLGGFLSYRLTPSFSLMGQVLFVQKGYRYTETNSYGTYKSRLTLNYLELPILAQYTFGADTFRYHAFAGPDFGFKMGGKYSYEYDGMSGEDSDMSHFKGMDLGLKFGAGLDYPIGPGRVGFDLAFIVGLCNMYADKDGDYKATNCAILFLFYYVFGGL
ncbi:MAG TPA: porin family protein [Acidobacteriota bacterium]